MILLRNREGKEFKRWHLAVLLIIILFAAGYRYFFWGAKTVDITLAGKNLNLLVADTMDLRFKGLSNYNTLGKHDGMLFIFSDLGQHEFVMRDMNFPLDIIWLNDKQVVDIAPNLPPEKGRTEAKLTLYPARAPSSYVLEVPAGYAQNYGLKVGDSWKILKYRLN